MPKFRIKESTKVILNETFYVEAETEEEAVEKYIEELAGTLETENSWIDPYRPENDGKVKVIK